MSDRVRFLKIIFIFFMIIPSENLFALTKSVIKTDANTDAESAKTVEDEILIGNFFSNSNYAANPSNEGLVENRYAVSLTYHPLEHWFGSFDANFFTDKTKNARYTQLTEFDRDIKIGYTDSTWDCYIENENDVAIGNAIYQSYTGFAISKKASYSIGTKDLSINLTAEKMLLNKSYYARPDNTGKADMRYIFHVDYDLSKRWVISSDNNFFTDENSRTSFDKLAKLSEFDCLIQVSYKLTTSTKIDLARETDMSIDQTGNSQTYWGGFLIINF